jgi:hypothetical protein
LFAQVMVTRQEAFGRRRAPSVTVNTVQMIALVSAFVGITAGFWHMSGSRGWHSWPPASSR